MEHYRAGAVQLLALQSAIDHRRQVRVSERGGKSCLDHIQGLDRARIIVLVVRCDQPFGEAVKPGGIEPERLDLMIFGKGGDSRRRFVRRLRRGFVDSHPGGFDVQSRDCTASGTMDVLNESLRPMITTYAAPTYAHHASGK